jgi:KaiC/GvpD/RAD55 family RecA-like ATPase
MEQLSINFLNEVYKLCFYKKEVIEIVQEHLKYTYIPNELKEYKKILKDMITYHTNNNKLPTIGAISQINVSDYKAQQILSDISNTKLVDKDESLKQFEKYIKRAKFQELYYKVTDVYNESDRQEEAMQLFSKESEEIVNFCLKKVNYFENIFSGFEERQRKRDFKRLTDDHSKLRIPFGVMPLDNEIYGGSEQTETDLLITRSGGGKTTYLVWRAISAARRGHPVLYVSLEGSKELLERKIDVAWSSVNKHDLELDNIDPEMRQRLLKVVNDIKNKKGEISVMAFDRFDTFSMLDLRNLVIDYIKINQRKPELICLDYLEKANPGDGRRYPVSTEGEKMRREAIADKFKNICTEFLIRGATATQATDIDPSDFNRPEYVMTRHNISGAKGLVNSFSYVFTFNQTLSEYSNETGRIYVDKMREYKANKIIYIATKFNKSRFYDNIRTIKLFIDEEVEE